MIWNSFIFEHSLETIFFFIIADYSSAAVPALIATVQKIQQKPDMPLRMKGCAVENTTEIAANVNNEKL
ncbi:hypothetical protein [Paenibacillus sp. PL91]|uniref:hypothetical protein n=1 Tax=Paenibacillus sp. PL91 TaxID=2729538 RepID=UPI00145F6CD3|nr:hypothetical protein [Paenibacillus sp. PL91]MBC9202887.1 hypothetical protein [Paenibacillus sp. PL91]